MTYSYVTSSVNGRYHELVFQNDMEDKCLNVRFLPTVELPFSKNNIDLQSMKMRDPEVIMAILEEHGLTLITKGIE